MLRASWLAALLIAAPATAEPDTPSPPIGLEAGLHQIGPGTLAYRPARPAPCASGYPLLILLHGTGGTSRGMIDALRAEADRNGIVLAAPTAAAENWDAVDSFFDDYERGSAAGRTRWATPRFGRDAGRLDALLAQLLADPAIDRGRVGILGFSHGASYALSYGAAHPRAFRSILAFSPGILVLPAEIGERQRVYVAHGSRDTVQPVQRTQDQFMPRLAALGFAASFRRFDGGHELQPAVLREGVRFFLEGSACASPTQ